MLRSPLTAAEFSEGVQLLMENDLRYPDMIEAQTATRHEMRRRFTRRGRMVDRK